MNFSELRMIHFDEFLRTVTEKKFFYDRFAEDDICGMFTPGHLFTIVLFFGLGALLLYFSRGITQERARKIRFLIALAVTLMEIAKIGIRVYKNQWYDSWVPLYYCSLFIFAVWASLARWEPLRRMGSAFITMGGIAASVFFTFYPSTSLAIFPLWHPAAIHSFIFHFLMFYTGILMLAKGEYTPDRGDSLLYFIFILAACIPSVVLNSRLGTNCMFLNHAFKLPIMEPIINYSKPLYMLLVFIGQSILMFWGNYFMFFGVKKIIASKRKKEEC